MLDLPHLIARGNAATPAPWTTNPNDLGLKIIRYRNGTAVADYVGSEDAAFIIAIRNAWPAIIAELEECERLKLSVAMHKRVISEALDRVRQLEDELATLRQRLDMPVKFENEEGT